MELTLSQRDRDAIVQQLRIALRKDIKAMATRQTNICKHPKYEYWWEHSDCQYCTVKKCARRMAPTYTPAGEIGGVTIGCRDFTPRVTSNQTKITF